MDYISVPKPRLWKGKADFFRPFRSTSTGQAGENIEPLFDPSSIRRDHDEPDLRDLNASLSALIDIFPHIEPEVFREMLLNMGEESRLQVVTEHLLKNKAKWTKGRYRTPERLQAKAEKRKAPSVAGPQQRRQGLPNDEQFRSMAYKNATKQVLYQEFRNLSHSTIKGVLAEHNYSYTTSRPTLQQLASRSWRFSLSGIFSRRDAPAGADTHPSIVWLPDADVNRPPRPAVRNTGNDELNLELFEQFVQPVVERREREQLAADHAAAMLLSETEAAEAQALFDCECCFDSVTFEQIAPCDANGHYVCFECLRRATKEAVYGQGWSRSVNLEKTTLSCMSSAADCGGCVPVELVKRACNDGGGDHDAWEQFEQRATGEALLRSGLALQRCPSCNYAEVDEIPIPSFKDPSSIWRHVAAETPLWMAILIICLLPISFYLLVPLLTLVAFGLVALQVLPPGARIINNSWTRVHRSRRTLKFTCQNPTCRTTTCRRCTRPWIDPHTCFDSERTSLRTAVESSATAAIKRTCPRCNLSFVKDSGCNKLVCNCGYTMCYVCRSQIQEKEGYTHFCQHFRPLGGKCAQCDKCDLYADENEDEVVKRAAVVAEKAWRKQRSESAGNAGIECSSSERDVTDAIVEAILGGKGGTRTWELWLDAVVDTLFI